VSKSLTNNDAEFTTWKLINAPANIVESQCEWLFLISSMICFRLEFKSFFISHYLQKSLPVK